MEDRERSKMRSRRILWGAIAMAGVVGTGAFVFASVPHTFTNGETLKADSLNGNFTALDQRLAAVEASIIPPGTVIAYGGPAGGAADAGAASVPPGWLLCDGSPVSRTTYANLFAAVGINFGGGDGINTFNLPDLRGRALIGAGHGSGLTNRTVGQLVGEETHTLSTAEMPSHTHVVNDPPHTHTVGPGGVGNQNGQAFILSAGNTCGITCTAPSFVGAFGQQTTNPSPTGVTIQSSGSGAAHNVMQPSAVLNYLIKI